MWELCRTQLVQRQTEMSVVDLEGATSAYLRPVCSVYTGVPDVKGLTLIPLSETSSNRNDSETDFLQRIFVYGVGLQVYDLDTSVGKL